MTFILQQADSQEFARWWVVYRNANEDFSQGFAERYQDIINVPYCHWILKDNIRIGGCVSVGENIGDFFLIPPFQDVTSALKAILPTDGRLVAQGILSEHVEAFEQVGFETKESRCWMLRPTQIFDNNSLKYDRTSPQPTQIDTIADLMLNAFQGGVGQYGRRDVDAHRQSIESYFKNITLGDRCHQASSIVFDGEQMIAICLIQPYKSLVTIRFVVVHPDYQRQGIAKQLIQYGINIIQDDYNYVGLAVTIGNPARDLYHKMGFVQGVATHVLVRD